MNKQDLFTHIDAEERSLRESARTIWEFAEPALAERRSADHLASRLEREGFDVTMGVGDLPTAFVASFGSGGPTIGLFGEYDALPGLSQKATPTRDPVHAGDPGHGCGHNLHGVGALGGAIASKTAIERGAVDGTVVYCGCPAEETLVGKAYMARAGAFDDLDAALAWHPADVSSVRLGTANALDSIEYAFTGDAAHAATQPASGRSALDAVQLLNTGAEYMREHLPDDARLHYVITDGGDAPNVVPDHAAVNYFVRSPSRDGVDRISAWLDDIATGAAAMTRTSVDRRYLTGCHGYAPNETVGMQIWENMAAVGAIEYPREATTFARALVDTIPTDARESRLARYPDDVRRRIGDVAVYPVPEAPFDRGGHSAGTADLGEVCAITPTVQFRGACWPAGTPAHTWQAVAASGGMGTHGVTFAAKVFAGTVWDLLSDPTILEEAHDEHAQVTGGEAYECPIPADVAPPVPS